MGDLKNYPIAYVTMPLFSIRLPSNLEAVPNQEDILNYFYYERNSYPNDIKLVPVKNHSVVMFKSKGYPSGVVMIDGRIYLVSTPLKGINQNGDLMFLNHPLKKDKGIEITKPSVAVIGQELKFSSSLKKSLIRLFEKAPEN